MAMKGNAQNQMTLGQLREFHIRVLAALPLDMPWEVAQGWIQNPRSLAETLAGVLMPVTLVEAKKVLANWQQFYRKFFGIGLDLSSVKIPEQQPGFDRLIVVAKGLTLNQVYDVCAKHFPCWRYTEDLDKAVFANDRTANAAYAVWFRDRQEADEELKNLSADQLKEQGIPGITLLERLLYELKFWDETKKHLDIQNWTLCTGSRCSDGSVPRVRWRGDGLGVSWCSSGYHCVNLRSRAAVPCQP